MAHVAQVHGYSRHHDRDRRREKVERGERDRQYPNETPRGLVADDQQEYPEHAELNHEVDDRGTDVGERENLARERNLLHQSRAVHNDTGGAAHGSLEHVPDDEAAEEVDDEIGDP